MSDVLLQVYLFFVIFSFLLWLTTPETKAEAVVTKQEVNLVEISDNSHNQIQEDDKEFFSKVNDFGESEWISKEKVYDAIKSLTLRDARKVAKRLGVKQKVGNKTRNKGELIEKNLEHLEIDHQIVIEALQEIKII